MNHRVLRLPEVLNKTGLSKSSVYALAREGQFPAAISLGGNAVGWVEEEIDKWIEMAMRARQSSPVAATLSM